MKTINDLLDEAKQKTKIESDNALAKRMGVTRTTISYYRHNKSKPDIYAISRLADLTGRPIQQIIALVEIEKEQPEEKRKYWENFYKRLGGVAASFSIIALLAPICAAIEDLHCILC